jgi:hypothetical protein
MDESTPADLRQRTVGYSSGRTGVNAAAPAESRNEHSVRGGGKTVNAGGKTVNAGEKSVNAGESVAASNNKGGAREN